MKNIKSLNRRKYKSMYRRAVWKHVQSRLKTIDFDAFDQAIGMGGKNEYPL